MNENEPPQRAAEIEVLPARKTAEQKGKLVDTLDWHPQKAGP